jgi:O-antigen/teichoic acid export membrane protein
MNKIIKKHYTYHKETIHNFIWRSLQVFAKEGMIFFIFILCAKLLSPYDFGIYNYVLAVLFFLILFGDFGISTATSKYVAEYNTTDKNKLKSILFNSGIIITILTILIILLTISFGQWYLKEKYIYVLYLLPLIFLAPMTSLYDGVYRGLKRFKQLSLISLTAGIFSLPFVYILIKIYGLIGALIAQNMFYLILLISLGSGYREFNLKWDKSIIKEVGVYSFALGVATVGYYFFSRVSILILGHYNYFTEIATYELLNKIFLVTLIPFAILSQVIAPDITRLYAKEDFFNLSIKFKKYFKYSVIFSVLFFIASFILLPYVIKFFFYEYYNQLLFAIIVPVVIFFALQIYCSILNSIILISNKFVNIASYLNIFLAIFNLLLSLIFLNLFGYIGIIYCTLISNLLGIIFLHIVYYIYLKKNKTKR